MNTHCYDDHVNETEVGWAGGTYGGEERCVQVLVATVERKHHLGNVRGRWIFNIWNGKTWIGLNLDQDRER